MTEKPPIEIFIKLPVDVIISDAWRSLGINGRRVIDFLMAEHAARGGKENGRLKAPYRQLADLGIGDRFVADAIREVEQVGLVDCHRGGMRVASTYGLAWLPKVDGKASTAGWRTYRNPALKVLPERRRRKQEAARCAAGQAAQPGRVPPRA